MLRFSLTKGYIYPMCICIYRLSGALVTRTTVEVMIPAHAVTSIIGDGGNRIVQIRQVFVK